MKKPRLSVRAISRELGVSRNTMRKHLGVDESDIEARLPSLLG